MKHLAVIRAEATAYLSNVAALFWTFVYPVAMLTLLVVLFDRDGDQHGLAEYRARTVIGLVALTIVSTAIFGLGQALCDMRARHALTPYYLTPLSLFSLSLCLIAARVAIVLIFGLIYVPVSFRVLGVEHEFGMAGLATLAAVFTAACLFAFSLAILLAFACLSSQTMIALANVLNLYAIMSADVFIPLHVLPQWSAPFVSTSPFYHLNDMLRRAVENPGALDVWSTAALLAVLGLAITAFCSRRRLFLGHGA